MRRSTVRDVMTSHVVAVRMNTPFKEVARVLHERRLAAVPVLDEDDHLVGIVSESDLLAKEERREDTAYGTGLFASHQARVVRIKAEADTAAQAMTAPAVTINPEATVAEAARRLNARHIKRLPVLDDHDRLIGIVSRADLIKTFLRPDEEIREEVNREVFAHLLWADPTVISVDVRDGVVTLTGRLEENTSIPVAIRLTHAVEGVVDVVNRLTYVIDDSKRHIGSSPLL